MLSRKLHTKPERRFGQAIGKPRHKESQKTDARRGAVKLVKKSNHVRGQNVPRSMHESLAAAVQLQWKILPQLRGLPLLYFTSRAESAPNFDVCRGKFHFPLISKAVRFIHFLFADSCDIPQSSPFCKPHAQHVAPSGLQFGSRQEPGELLHCHILKFGYLYSA